MDRTATALGEERLDDRAVSRRDRQVDLPWDGPGPAVVLLEETGQDLIVGRFSRRIEHEDVAPDQLAVADDEELHGRLIVLPRHPNQIEFGVRERCHLLALHRPLDGADLVAQSGGPLVVDSFRRCGHLLLQCLHHCLLATFQKQHHLLDVRAVGSAGDSGDARTLAALDMEQEAWPLEGPDAVLDVDRAGAEREQPTHQVHRFVDARRGGVWSEVAAPVVDELARPFDPRKVIGHGDFDVRVALVVLEAHVEARSIALDEVRFEEQGLGDGVGLRDLDVGHAVDDAPDAMDLAAGRLLLPVGAHTAAQALGLADIQHVAPRVLHEVDARLVGKLGEGGREFGGHAPMLGQDGQNVLRRAAEGRRATVSRRCARGQPTGEAAVLAHETATATRQGRPEPS